MQKLTKKEFIDRTNAVLRARKIFIGSGITNNITEAFAIYQEVLAEQERMKELTTELDSSRLKISDILPICPECGLKLRPRRIRIEQGPKNVYGYRSCWMCLGEECVYERFSTETIEEQLLKLEKKKEGGG